MNQFNAPLEVSCHQVREDLLAGKRLLLVDCRTADEHQFVALDGAVLIPMHELPARIGEIEPHRQHEIVVFCHHGVRSAQVANWLRQHGFRAQSMEGGIDQWAEEIDPELPRY